MTAHPELIQTPGDSAIQALIPGSSAGSVPINALGFADPLGWFVGFPET